MLQYDMIQYDAAEKILFKPLTIHLRKLSSQKIKLFSQESIFDREQTTCNYSRNHSFAMHF